MAKKGHAIFVWWCMETMAHWLLPPEVWEPLEQELTLVHQKFRECKTTAEQDAIIEKLWDLCYKATPENQEKYAEETCEPELAAWGPYLHDAKQTRVGLKIDRLFITGEDPI